MAGRCDRPATPDDAALLRVGRPFGWRLTWAMHVDMTTIAWRHGMPAVERRVAAAPEAAWRVWTDLDAWPKWGPTVIGAALGEPGPLRLGSTGKVWTPVGVPLPFTITEFVEGEHWAWRVAGVPATKHGVEPDAGGCRIWMTVPIWAPPYLTVCAVALKRIERLAVS